jgi:methylenetetrahydrofolate reductase (NADPH)
MGGHPEGHPNMTEANAGRCWKPRWHEIEARGMAPLVVTQFGSIPMPS